MDVSLALLPITIIWGLSLNVGKKVALSTLLGLGIL